MGVTPKHSTIKLAESTLVTTNASNAPLKDRMEKHRKIIEDLEATKRLTAQKNNQTRTKMESGIRIRDSPTITAPPPYAAQLKSSTSLVSDPLSQKNVKESLLAMKADDQSVKEPQPKESAQDANVVQVAKESLAVKEGLHSVRELQPKASAQEANVAAQAAKESLLAVKESRQSVKELKSKGSVQESNVDARVPKPNASKDKGTLKAGGNGTGQGNETEDEDHEFFDAMEEGVSANAEDKNSFVIKVPMNRRNKVKSEESSDESEGETVTETQQVVFVEDKQREAMGGATDAAASSKPEKVDIKVWPHVSCASPADGRVRRARVPDKPNLPLSLWSIMKNCIGKELSKIPIPVNFSEPLSMLQRLTEDYEYSYILDEASKFDDPAQQLAYVAAFTVSSYSTTANRTNKPFNPLLGETFECDRMADLGWRSISEQVSHHPPMVAQFCEGSSGWQCWQEFTMTTKFRGKYLQVIPLGAASAMFPASGNKYTWRKVMHHPPMLAMFVEGASGWDSSFEWSISSRFGGTCINILPDCDIRTHFKSSGCEYRYGKVMHHPPTMCIYVEGASGWTSLMQFGVTSTFRGQYLRIHPDCEGVFDLQPAGSRYRCRKVTTTVHNIIVGKLWVDNHGDMDITGEAGPAAGYVAHLKYQPYSYFSKETQRKVTGVIKDPNGVPRYVLQGYWDDRVEVAPVTSASDDGTQCTTGKFTVAWERVPQPPDSDKWYNFTLLAAQLNEPEEGVAPTDSRLRPDQRLMEEGLWDQANAEKLRLEEKQRVKRRELEEAREQAVAKGLPPPTPPKPLWFTREAVSTADSPHLCHMYNHKYWDCKRRQDWAGCPDIF